MTNDEVKEYLNRYIDAAQTASAAQRHLEKLRARSKSVTRSYDAEGGGAPIGDRLGEAVAKIIDAENRVSDELELLVATEHEVIGVIKNVEDSKQRTLLYERYVNGKTFEEISVLIGKSWRQTHRIHSRALRTVSKILESE